MTTFAVIGAGPGLGAAVARRFGRAGHVDLYDKTDLIPFDTLEEFFTKKNLA